MNLLVDGGGLLLIAGIAWWFWGSRRAPVVVPVAGHQAASAAVPGAAQSGAGVVEILVADGVYTPAEIAVPVGRDTVLRFLRRDRSPCAEMVLIDGLGLSAQLPIDAPVDIRVHPEKAGRYEFTCQMRMYRGTLVAVDAAVA